MSERVPRVARWILACAGLLVPGYRREAWRRQWIAELEHRYASGGEIRVRVSCTRAVPEERGDDDEGMVG
jgi:hypothetical protein